MRLLFLIKPAIFGRVCLKALASDDYSHKPPTLRFELGEKFLVAWGFIGSSFHREKEESSGTPYQLIYSPDGR